MNRFDLLRIHSSGFCLLAAGFVTSLLIPKIAINEIGINGYGDFAVILGFCLIPLFFEFGLTPGLTRELGSLYAQDKYENIFVITKFFQKIIGFVGLLAILTVSFIAASKGVGNLSEKKIILSIWAGGGANILALMTDIGLIQSKVAGRIVQANFARSIYFVIYLSLVIIMAYLNILHVREMFLAQLMGSLGYFYLGRRVGRKNAKRLKPVEKQNMKIPWKGLLTTAAPEQINRAQSSLLPSFERSSMQTIGGSPAIAAYDIALRFSAIVTALPATLAAPLVALLSPNIEKGEHKINRLIVKYTEIITLLLVVVSSVAVLLFIKFIAVNFYSLEGTPVLLFSFIIIGGSSVNVLTAAPTSFLYSHNKPSPVFYKSSSDAILGVLAVVLMLIYRNPIIFIVVRYGGYILTSSLFLTYYYRVRLEYK